GQTVEIITAPGAKPNPAWLNFVVSGKAKSSIRHYLKHQRQTESRDLGRLLLKKSLNSFGRNLDELTQEQMDRVVQHNQVGNFERLLEDIGLGNRMAYIVARQLVPDDENNAPAIELHRMLSKPSVTIKGTEGLVVTFAHCCKPIPGDAIVGMIDSGSGMVIHSESCDKVARYLDDPNRSIHLNWAKDITDEFVVELRVELARQRGVIAELASAVTMADGNIEKISVEEQDAHLSTITLVIHVQGRRHLARVMRRIRNMKAVTNIQRIRH